MAKTRFLEGSSGFPMVYNSFNHGQALLDTEDMGLPATGSLEQKPKTSEWWDEPKVGWLG